MALHAQQPGTAFVFYAQPQVSEDLWPALFQVLHDDFDGELPGVIADKTATFVHGPDSLLGVSFSEVISVKLLGRCDILPQVDRPASHGPLGWVWMVSGEIEPFVSIDCTRLAQVLRPAVAGLDKEERRYAMLQAIAHVLIHEWSHIASQNPSHTKHGLTRADLSARELMGTAQRSHWAH